MHVSCVCVVAQDESERLQQLAANKAAASATGASKKWNKWGGGGASAAAATDKAGAPAAAGGDGTKGAGKAADKGKRGREDSDGVQFPPSKRPATAAAGRASPLPAGAPPTRAAEGVRQTGASAAQPLPSAARGARHDADAVVVELRDLICVMERDPHYAKSMLLYELMESQP